MNNQPLGQQHQTSRRDPDRHGSRRTLLAGVLLRRGNQVDQVAEVTGIPIALVELIRDELDDQADRPGRTGA